jgi:hypothetical protein
MHPKTASAMPFGASPLSTCFVRLFWVQTFPFSRRAGI